MFSLRMCTSCAAVGLQISLFCSRCCRSCPDPQSSAVLRLNYRDCAILKQCISRIYLFHVYFPLPSISDFTLFMHEKWIFSMLYMWLSAIEISYCKTYWDQFGAHSKGSHVTNGQQLIRGCNVQAVPLPWNTLCNTNTSGKTFDLFSQCKCIFL